MPRLLIANDNFYLLEGYVELLGGFFAVDSAINGVLALDMVQNKPKYFYDVIILDIHMPIMGGIEASNKIHHFLEGENVLSFLNLSSLVSSY